MSIFDFFSSGKRESPPLPAQTDTVRKIVDALDRLEADHARYLAAFAYVLSRVARADLKVSPEETRAMERTVIEHIITAWRTSQVTDVIVTLHARDVALQDVVSSTGAETVVLDPPPVDMKASVAGGLDHVARRYRPDAGDVWLLAPADVPTLDAAVINRLLAAHDPGSSKILVAAHEGRCGHPALFPWPLAAAVERLAADEGINRLLRLHPTELIECGPAALVPDLDTPEDYRRLRADKAGE